MRIIPGSLILSVMRLLGFVGSLGFLGGLRFLGALGLLFVNSPSFAAMKVEDMRIERRFGFGASAGGQLSMMGIEMDINCSENFSVGAGLGTGVDYSTSMVKAKYYISGQWVSPYLAASLARWWTDGTLENLMRPNVLANKFLDPGQNLRNGFDIMIFSPSFGVQFMHSTGLSFYFELQYLFKLMNFAHGTYAGGGMLWYF